MRKLFTFLTLAILAIGWASAETWTYTFNGEKNIIQRNKYEQEFTVNDAKWALNAVAGYLVDEKTNGLHLGTNNADFTSIKLSTSDIPGIITKVTVNAKNAGTRVVGKVQVGDQASDEVTVQAAYSDLEFQFANSASGDLAITFTRKIVGKKAFYIRSITIEYIDTSVKAPTFTPQSGEVEVGATVGFGVDIDGAILRYTTDGTEPTAENGTVYQGNTFSTQIFENTTFNAVADLNGELSPVATASYTMTYPTPTIAGESGYVTAGTEIAVTPADGYLMVYTIDGTDPTTSETAITADSEIQVAINGDVTIKAASTLRGTTQFSEVVAKAYHNRVLNSWTHEIRNGGKATEERDLVVDDSGKYSGGEYNWINDANDVDGTPYAKWNVGVENPVELYYGNGRGIQIGKNPTNGEGNVGTLTLTTTAFADCNISSVTFSGGVATSTEYDLTVYVGGEEVGSIKKMESFANYITDYTISLETPKRGSEIKIEITNITKAVYLGGLTVVYEIIPEEEETKLVDIINAAELPQNATIADALTAVKVVVIDERTCLLAKDDNNYMNLNHPFDNRFYNKIEMEEGQIDIIAEIWNRNSATKMGEYDQSNWVLLDLSATEYNTVEAAQPLVGQTYTGIKGDLLSNVNPVFHVTSWGTEAGANEYIPNNLYPAGFMQDYVQDSFVSEDEMVSLFFMPGKPMEYCKLIWAQCLGKGETGLYTFGVIDDNKTVMQYGIVGQVSGYTLDKDQTFTEGEIYNLECIVMVAPNNDDDDDDDDNPDNPGIDNAPAKSTTTGSSTMPANYSLIILDGKDIITTGIDDVDTTNATVTNVRYYNLAGQASSEAHEGVNIVVTEWSNGARTAAKVIK